MEEVGESVRVRKAAQQRSGCSRAGLGTRSKSYKTNGVVPLTGFEPTTAESKVRRL